MSVFRFSLCAVFRDFWHCLKKRYLGSVLLNQLSLWSGDLGKNYSNFVHFLGVFGCFGAGCVRSLH